jgi:hypothetical protein
MGSVNFRDSINTLVISPDTSGYNYANTNKPVRGTYVSPTTATFNATWLLAPSYIPPTSVDSFIFFVNGLNIEKQAIASFTESSTESTLVIDPNILQFSFDESDVILAIGKFN